ncbi:MAG: MAPEG family protein [Pseudomonadota bacterium]
MSIFVLCSGALILLFAALSLFVSTQRISQKRGFGVPDDPKNLLTKAIRAHCNAAEYIPLLVILFLYFDLRALNNSWITAFVILGTLGRFLHAAGMLMSSSLARPQPLRFVGTIATYTTLICLGILLFTTASPL